MRWAEGARRPSYPNRLRCPSKNRPLRRGRNDSVLTCSGDFEFDMLQFMKRIEVESTLHLALTSDCIVCKIPVHTGWLCNREENHPSEPDTAQYFMSVPIKERTYDFPNTTSLYQHECFLWNTRLNQQITHPTLYKWDDDNIMNFSHG